MDVEEEIKKINDELKKVNKKISSLEKKIGKKKGNTLKAPPALPIINSSNV